MPAGAMLMGWLVLLEHSLGSSQVGTGLGSLWWGALGVVKHGLGVSQVGISQGHTNGVNGGSQG